MPFKDINWKRAGEVESMRYNLGKTIAEVNKLSPASPFVSASDKINAAELIGGKKLRKPTDIIKQLTLENKQDPIINKLGKIENQIGQFAAIGDTPTAPAQLALPQPPSGVDLYERYGFTDADMEYYEKSRFANLNELAVEGDQTQIREATSRLNDLYRKLGAQKGGIKRKTHPSTGDMDRLDRIVTDQGHIDKYRQVLKKISVEQQGQGANIPIGSYVIPKRRLVRDNILSVRYKKRPSKLVPSFGSMKVSDNVKKTLLNTGFPREIPKSANLSTTEKLCLSKLGVYTNLGEIKERARVLLGQIQAGNTSVELRSELMSILHYLYKKKVINKVEYTDLISSISKT